MRLDHAQHQDGRADARDFSEVRVEAEQCGSGPRASGRAAGLDLLNVSYGQADAREAAGLAIGAIFERELATDLDEWA